MTEQITQILDILAVFVGVIGTAVIMVGVFHAVRGFFAIEILHKHTKAGHDLLRYGLGTYLLLGLEFLVAADILETVFKPSLEQLGVLGGIVIIRTALNYFLDRELSHIKEEIK